MGRDLSDRSSQPCRVRFTFKAEGTESAEAPKKGDQCMLGTERIPRQTGREWGRHSDKRGGESVAGAESEGGLQMLARNLTLQYILGKERGI